MVHGIIHLNGRLHQNENIIRQTVIVADILSSFVTELSQHCEVCVYSACGNHGRVSANVKESIKEEKVLTEENEAKLIAAINEFKAEF